MSRYMILDSEGIPVAKGSSKQHITDEIWKVKLDEPVPVYLQEQAYVTLVGTSSDMAGLEGHIVKLEKNAVYIKPIRRIGEKVRNNLRIPVSFSSYVYPVSGKWKGRCAIISHDLSCGGIAFYTDHHLEVGELAEIVLPVTTNPLLLYIKVLRKVEETPGRIFYACCFVDLIHDQEMLLREAVFNIQIERRKMR